MPPAGHVAGINAHTDIHRGVPKAPANEVVCGILKQDLGDGRRPLTHVLGARAQDLLNPCGVNVIRDFRSTGRGVRIWDARTMSSDPMWKYVSVRRQLIFVERSLHQGMQWVVFEPMTTQPQAGCSAALNRDRIHPYPICRRSPPHRRA